MDNLLVLVRHGQSEWNQKNLFTGWKDVMLTERGIAQAREAGQMLLGEDIKFDLAYTSVLVRAQHTLELILDELGQANVKTIKHKALNERDYGELSGLNKDEARRKWGDDKVYSWRRSYDIAPPGGESLKDTAARVLPYYQSEILPNMRAGKNIIISGHGNALRALIMRLEGLTSEQITMLSIKNGIPLIYRINEDGTAADKRDLAA